MAGNLPRVGLIEAPALVQAFDDTFFKELSVLAEGRKAEPRRDAGEIVGKETQGLYAVADMLMFRAPRSSERRFGLLYPFGERRDKALANSVQPRLRTRRCRTCGGLQNLQPVTSPDWGVNIIAIQARGGRLKSDKASGGDFSRGCEFPL